MSSKSATSLSKGELIVRRIGLITALALSFALTCAVPAIAQQGVAVSLRNGTSNPAACRPASTNVFLNRTTGAINFCSATNTWLPADRAVARLILAGDVSTAADTVLVDLTGMTFTAAAGKTYLVTINGTATAAANTTGFGFGVNCAQAPVLVSLSGSSQLANTGTSDAWSAIANNAIVGTTSGIPTNATNVPTVGGGVIRAHAATAGTCTFRFRSETTAVATAKAGTVIVVTQVD
jgi:hypothetical protein